MGRRQCTHALVYGFAFSFFALLTSLRTTYFLVSSCLPKLKNFLIFVTLFGPNLSGNTLSVNAGPCSPPAHSDHTTNRDVRSNNAPSNNLEWNASDAFAKRRGRERTISGKRRLLRPGTDRILCSRHLRGRGHMWAERRRAPAHPRSAAAECGLCTNSGVFVHVCKRQDGGTEEQCLATSEGTGGSGDAAKRLSVEVVGERGERILVYAVAPAK
jgi:hypothetical protein